MDVREPGMGAVYFDRVDHLWRCAYHGDPLVDGDECLTCDEEDEAIMGGEIEPESRPPDGFVWPSRRQQFLDAFRIYRRQGEPWWKALILAWFFARSGHDNG